jgi:hypothetical protein
MQPSVRSFPPQRQQHQLQQASLLHQQSSISFEGVLLAEKVGAPAASPITSYTYQTQPLPTSKQQHCPAATASTAPNFSAGSHFMPNSASPVSEMAGCQHQITTFCFCAQ